MAQAAIRRRFRARIERPHNHLVSELEALDSGAELGNGPRHLVPDHLWRAHPTVHGPVRDVQIRAANTTVGDLQPHLAGSRGAGVAGSDGEHARALVVGGTHRAVRRHNTII